MEIKVENSLNQEADAQASSRKEDHIDMAFNSAVDANSADDRFFYEPMISSHPGKEMDMSFCFRGKTMQYPLWVSSMTGGTEKANTINHNLARMCGELGLGMGLGSCRQLLYDDKRLHEFDIRAQMKDQPLLINLGVAQVEELLKVNETYRISQLINNLQAGGLIIHVNPLQEWLQPEGDRFKVSSLETVKALLDVADYPVIVKEVGQGFGKQSLIELLKLPLAAIDLAGYGGTNFSKLELLRSDPLRLNSFERMFKVGHTCTEMLHLINEYCDSNASDIKVGHIIFSGGIKNFLDGYYLLEQSKLPCFYAQASSFLKHAMDYDALLKHTHYQIEGLKMAKAFLRIKH